MLFGYPLFKGSKTPEISTLNKNFKYDDLIQLVARKQSDSKSLPMKLGTIWSCFVCNFLGLHLLLKLLHNDPKQRISAKEALHDAYFKPQESFHSKKSPKNESEIVASPKKSITIFSQNTPKKVSFDLSPNTSNGSSSLKKSFSEAVSHLESSTLSPSNTSLRKSSENNLGKRTPRSCFKDRSRFKSVEEMKLLVRFSVTSSSETLMLQKIKRTHQNGKDSENIHESASLSSPKNYPTSPKFKKHPNQKI